MFNAKLDLSDLIDKLNGITNADLARDIKRHRRGGAGGVQ